MSEFGRVCERGKLRVNIGKSKVMRCSRYCNACEWKKWIVLSTKGRKWQLMDDLKVMFYTE